MLFRSRAERAGEPTIAAHHEAGPGLLEPGERREQPAVALLALQRAHGQDRWAVAQSLALPEGAAGCPIRPEPLPVHAPLHHAVRRARAAERPAPRAPAGPGGGGGGERPRGPARGRAWGEGGKPRPRAPPRPRRGEQRDPHCTASIPLPRPVTFGFRGLSRSIEPA